MPNLGVREQMGVNVSKYKPPDFIQPNQLIKIPVKDAQQNGRAFYEGEKETVKFHTPVSFLNTSCENV